MATWENEKLTLLLSNLSRKPFITSHCEARHRTDSKFRETGAVWHSNEDDEREHITVQFFRKGKRVTTQHVYRHSEEGTTGENVALESEIQNKVARRIRRPKLDEEDEHDDDSDNGCGDDYQSYNPSDDDEEDQHDDDNDCESRNPSDDDGEEVSTEVVRVRYVLYKIKDDDADDEKDAWDSDTLGSFTKPPRVRTLEQPGLSEEDKAKAEAVKKESEARIAIEKENAEAERKRKDRITNAQVQTILTGPFSKALVLNNDQTGTAEGGKGVKGEMEAKKKLNTRRKVITLSDDDHSLDISNASFDGKGSPIDKTRKGKGKIELDEHNVQEEPKETKRHTKAQGKNRLKQEAKSQVKNEREAKKKTNPAREVITLSDHDDQLGFEDVVFNSRPIPISGTTEWKETIDLGGDNDQVESRDLTKAVRREINKMAKGVKKKMQPARELEIITLSDDDGQLETGGAIFNGGSIPINREMGWQDTIELNESKDQEAPKRVKKELRRQVEKEVKTKSKPPMEVVVVPDDEDHLQIHGKITNTEDEVDSTMLYKEKIDLDDENDQKSLKEPSKEGKRPVEKDFKTKAKKKCRPGEEVIISSDDEDCFKSHGAIISTMGKVEAIELDGNNDQSELKEAQKKINESVKEKTKQNCKANVAIEKEVIALSDDEDHFETGAILDRITGKPVDPAMQWTETIELAETGPNGKKKLMGVEIPVALRGRRNAELSTVDLTEDELVTTTPRKITLDPPIIKSLMKKAKEKRTEGRKIERKAVATAVDLTEDDPVSTVSSNIKKHTSSATSFVGKKEKAQKKDEGADDKTEPARWQRNTWKDLRNVELTDESFADENPSAYESESSPIEPVTGESNRNWTEGEEIEDQKKAAKLQGGTVKGSRKNIEVPVVDLTEDEFLTPPQSPTIHWPVISSIKPISGEKEGVHDGEEEPIDSKENEQEQSTEKDLLTFSYDAGFRRPLG
jgi:hypothetical protein